MGNLFIYGCFVTLVPAYIDDYGDPKLIYIAPGVIEPMFNVISNAFHPNDSSFILVKPR